MDLSIPPTPLTPRQRTVVWAVAAVCAAMRFVTMARSLWDWDETLFCLGLREYDITNHHPHPPGFPLFIAAAKTLRLVIDSDFRALQTLSMLAGFFVFPAVYMLARELRLRFDTAVIAGALFAFFPNVWFFGGTAFSDVPSIVLVTIAAALLFRGVRDRRAYWLGTLLLALASGIRPQNLLIGLWPGLVATRHRSWRDIVVALLIGIVIVGGAYGGAIYATGSYEKYMSAVRSHSEYISKIDSWRSPERPPLWRLFDRFFIKQYQSPALSVITSFFVLIATIAGIRRRDRSLGWVGLTFGPIAIMAWLMLDRFSISRFSIGYLPMFAVLAAYGIAEAARGKLKVERAIGAVLVGAFVVYTALVAGPVRNEPSPPVQAVQAIAKNFDPARHELFVAYSMTPYMQYFIPQVPFVRVLDDRSMPMSSSPAKQPYLFAELTETQPERLFFSRERGQLWNITRRHYFEVLYKPVRLLPEFVAGWYPPERAGLDEWRWMAGHSVTRLPAMTSETKLRLYFDVPPELLPNRPTVTITLNGTIVDRFQPTEEHTWREHDVQPAPNGAPNTLELAIDQTIHPVRDKLGDDPRELGLLVKYLAWGPVSR